ncbi:MAG: HNH endonuclease [Quinella sp. 1Q7]|nr:HNH endonuclease [Quinella sp. 1Q7]
MTIDEAKKILLAANLSPTERNALYVLLEEIGYGDLPDEIWRDVVGYEGYYKVSNFGRVKSFHKGKSKILKFGVSPFGYLRVVLCKDFKKKNRPIHILVAQAFIPNPDNKRQINHIDGDKTNNHVSNLEWATPAENIHHAFAMGLRKSGYEHFRAKFTPEQVREIRRDCVPGDPERGFKPLAKKFNVTPRIISDAYYCKSYQNVD